MAKRPKNIFLVSLMALILLSLSFFSVIGTAKNYSFSERRTLAQKPALSAESLLSGKYTEQYESYLLDQFPQRDGFRSLKALASRYLFGQKDHHGLYSVNGWLSRLNYPLDAQKLGRSLRQLSEINDLYLSGSHCKSYLSVIPDKNLFLAPLGGYPAPDYSLLVSEARSSLSFAEYIDIFPLLSLEDYYKTDQHWRQEKITDIAQALADGIGAALSDTFTENVLDTPFYGAYCAQSALRFPADTIRFFTSDILSSCTVTSYDTGLPRSAEIYDMEKAHGHDPYEMFLSGADALITIENPRAENPRELIIFRDSFGSSIAPLLVSAYSKITLVDLRYIRSDLIGSFVDFEAQDVLFLYSTLVLNS